jgi:uncharacterized protein YjbJ (UPF0337 family)
MGVWHVDFATGHHPPPLVQGRYLGVVGDAAGYAHIFLSHRHDGNFAARRRVGPTSIFPTSILNEHPSWESAMNWDRVEGNWKQFKGKAQEQWGKLTDDDLDVIEGRRTELAGRLQQRYGYAKDQAEREIDNWLDATS